MAKIIFEAGDIFTCSEGTGVVLNEETQEVVICVASGRSVYKAHLPGDAFPVKQPQNLNYEVQLALKAAYASVCEVGTRLAVK